MHRLWNYWYNDQQCTDASVTLPTCSTWKHSAMITNKIIWKIMFLLESIQNAYFQCLYYSKSAKCVFFQLFPMGLSHGSAPDRSSSHGKMDVISHVSLPSQFQSSWNFENPTSFQLPPLPSHGSEGPIIHTTIHVNNFQYYNKHKKSLISCKWGVSSWFFEILIIHSSKIWKNACRKYKNLHTSRAFSYGRL